MKKRLYLERKSTHYCKECDFPNENVLIIDVDGDLVCKYCRSLFDSKDINLKRIKKEEK